MEKISDVWDLEIQGNFRYRVVFNERVTLEEAIAYFNQNDHEDVIDSEEYNVTAIGEA